MHAHEVETDVALVRRLLAAQFPQWAHLPIRPVPSWGTDNALYRIGDDMVARLPRRKRTAATLEKERRWLPKLAPLLPLAVPEPLADGMPAGGYPFEWHVYRWLKGQDATVQRVTDPSRLAKRRGELVLVSADAMPGRPALGGYSLELLDRLLGVVAAAPAGAYGVYAVTAHSAWMALTVPLVVAGLGRYLVLVHRDDLGEEPEQVLLADRVILGCVAAWTVLSAAILAVT
jgi:hypothetical protein